MKEVGKDKPLDKVPEWMEVVDELMLDDDIEEVIDCYPTPLLFYILYSIFLSVIYQLWLLNTLANMSKRKHTDTLPDDPPQFVAYSDYLQFFNHVSKLTAIINELRSGIIESGSKTLGEKISSTCEPLPVLAPIGPPVLPPPIFDEVFSQAIVPTSYASATSQKSNPNAVPKVSSFTPNHLDKLEIAREAAKLINKATRAVIERFPGDRNDKEPDSKQLRILQNLASSNNLPVPVKIHRHDCKSMYRPLKVQFESSSDRDSFLHGFHIAHRTNPDILAMPSKPRARRDLTRPEWETLRASRLRREQESWEDYLHHV
ncbi:hypothetical protein GCK72_003797 [Caenorhabditis remanei]|uniref:Uncharacterized protein n=1 Tax=Caenorhabditis remanei TaxID=31234 RepID=A0A6A5HAG7_CAERE|nr:hypothetical protein GCK72_003797 [Caenorhabditis remanei]KAF1763851.1 hypothetical protein GCK72_003797 [Caenorhabditis remanei]